MSLNNHCLLFWAGEADFASLGLKVNGASSEITKKMLTLFIFNSLIAICLLLKSSINILYIRTIEL
jgi:hypothetical protein